MPNYYTFSAADAIEYAKIYGGVADFESLVSAEEIGDGNLNFVFKIRDHSGISRVIVKQALPYVRCVGESWPLTLDRSRIEAETLLAHYQYCPEHTVNVLHYDPELAVMVQEDLSEYTIWRKALIDGVHNEHAAAQIGHYLANALFHHSDFYQDQLSKKLAVSQFTNPELCQITEDLFFTDPYIEHERNRFEPELETLVHELRIDKTLLTAVGELKYKFMTHAESLLHGDLHSGSIFVTEDKLKVIDAEFGFYGPIGFDIGTVIGNLLLNYCSLDARDVDLHELKQNRIESIVEVWETFSNEFLRLVREKSNNPIFSQELFANRFLEKAWRDSMGYAGAELIRRVIGFAHVADLDTIADKNVRITGKSTAITLGRNLILHAPELQHINELINYIQDNGKKKKWSDD